MTESDNRILAGVELGGTKSIALIARGRTIIERCQVATGAPVETLDRDTGRQRRRDRQNRALEHLRRGASLRQAIEGLTAARERLPDFSETLGAIPTVVKKTSMHRADDVSRSFSSK